MKEATMELPLQLQFRNLEHSPAIEAAVRKHVEKLKFFNGDIISCRVAIESPHKHQYKGKLYHVVVDVRVPGKEIVVSRAPDDQQAHEDVYVAIRDAFDAARRQIQDYVKIRRGKVKSRENPPQGT
jgi:ribosome-associated translation inhibitor RaiA